MKLRILVLLFLFLGGCTSLNRLKPMCEKQDEEVRGRFSAEYGLSIVNFDIYANQCAKYNYRVPSKEKFMESFNHSMQMACATPKDYFQYSYKVHRKDGQPHDCPKTNENKFYAEGVSLDASVAAGYVEDIQKMDKEDRENPGNTLFDPKPTMNHYSRKIKNEELKVLVKKYGLFVSDLY